MCSLILFFVRIQSRSQYHIKSNSDCDFLSVTAEIGSIEKAIDIYSRRGAGDAGAACDCYKDSIVFIQLPLRSLRLCEKTTYSTSSIDSEVIGEVDLHEVVEAETVKRPILLGAVVGA